MAIYYECSDGSRVTQATIDKRYSDSRRKKHEGRTTILCECCGIRQAVHNDHTIAQARCKLLISECGQYHKTELIWNPNNYVSSCEQCHREWENFKSGKWLEHLNCAERLSFLMIHDPEGYTIRIELTRAALEEEAAKQQQQNDIDRSGIQHDEEGRTDSRHSSNHLPEHRSDQSYFGKPTKGIVYDASNKRIGLASRNSLEQ